MATDPTNGAGYDETGAPYLWVISPDGDREVARVAELPRLVLLGYVREDGIPMPDPAPGSMAAVLAALAALPAIYGAKSTVAAHTAALAALPATYAPTVTGTPGVGKVPVGIDGSGAAQWGTGVPSPDARLAATTADEFTVAFDDAPGSPFLRANPVDGITSKIAGSTLRRMADEANWAFHIAGSNEQTIFGVRPDGTIYPPVSTTTTLIPVVEVGDSLTDNRRGAPDNLLQTALGGRAFTNLGIGGQTGQQIAARFGAVPTAVTAASNTLPASGSVAVTLSVNLGQNNSDGTYSYPGILAGVPGTLTVVRSGGAYSATFTRTAAGSATPCPAGSPFQTGFGYRDAAPIICIGRNGVRTDTPASIVAIVEACLQWSTRRSRALVLSIPPFAGGDESGQGAAAKGAYYDQLVAANAALQAAFPTLWVDWGAYLRSVDTLAAVGITATTQDNTDIANGLTPTSFRVVSDAGHFNATAYNAINNLIVAEYTARGWSTS